MGSIVHRSVPINLKWLPNCSHAHALFQDILGTDELGLVAPDGLGLAGV